MPRSNFSPKKYLSDQQFDRLYSYCEKHMEEKEGLFIMLALKTGARCQELLNLTNDHLFKEKIKGKHHYSIEVFGVKGSKDRVIPIPANIYQRLVVRGYENKGKLFPMSYARVHQFWRDFTPDSKKTFHSLRHTFGMRLYRETKDILLVKYALGHKDVQNTMVYLDYVGFQDDLRKVGGLG